jgi:hypothetical protein
MKKQDNKSDSNNMNESFKQGIAGGLLGACVGVPGLGLVIGVANANKDKIKKFAKDFDNDT